MTRWLIVLMVLLVASPAFACGGFASFGGFGGCGSSFGFGGCGGYTSYSGCGGYVAGPSSVAYSDWNGCGCELPSNYYEQPSKTLTPTPAPRKAVLPEPAVEPESQKLPVAPSGPGPFEPTSFRRTAHKPVIPAGNATIVLHVPASAKVWINDRPTTKEGTLRKYVSLDLLEGRHYKYRVAVEVAGKVARRDLVLTARDTKSLRYK